MRNYILPLLLSCLLLSLSARCQKDSTVNKRTYKTWIRSYNRHQFTDGILYEIKDSSVIVLRNRPVIVQHKREVLSSINYRYIDDIKVRSKGSIMKGMLIGGLCGALLGTWAGISISQNHPEEMEAYITPILLTGCGVGLGTLFGCIKIRIPINGNEGMFTYYRNQLNSYAKHRNY